MKNIILIISSLILLSQNLFGQLNEKKYDPYCFLIGTLNEYMGYSRIFEPSKDTYYFNKINSYDRNQLNDAVFVQQLFEKQFPDLKIKNNGSPNGILLYSKKLSKKIDSYFTYSKSVISTVNLEPIYTGVLKSDALKSKKEKISYLMGVFHTYGKYTNGTYFIRLSNAPSKASITADLLKELGCEKVEYSFKANMIPVPHDIVFMPTKELADIWNEAEELRLHIYLLSTENAKYLD